MRVSGNIVIKPSVQQRFDGFMQSGRVLFFSAPCGFGESTLASALLAGRNVLRQSAGAADFSLPAPADGWDVLLLDDLQTMQDERGWQALCELIRSEPAKRFVLLSRGVPPGCLTAFQYSGLMTTLESDDLLFDREDIRKFFAAAGLAVTDSEISGILKESIGYPLGVAAAARWADRREGHAVLRRRQSDHHRHGQGRLADRRRRAFQPDALRLRRCGRKYR